MGPHRYKPNSEGWLTFHPLSKALPRTCGLVPPKHIIVRPSNWMELTYDRVKVHELCNAYQMTGLEFRVLMRFIRWFAIRHLDVRKRYTEQSPEYLEFYKREVLLWKPLGRFLLQYEESWILEVTTRRLFIRRNELVRLRQRLVLFNNITHLQQYGRGEKSVPHTVSAADIDQCIPFDPPGFECPQSCAEGSLIGREDTIVNSMRDVEFDSIPSPFSSQTTVTSQRMDHDVPESSSRNSTRASSHSLALFLRSLTPNMEHMLPHFRTAGIDDEAFADILDWNPYLRASFLRKELKTRCTGYQLQVIITGMDRFEEVPSMQ